MRATPVIRSPWASKTEVELQLLDQHIAALERGELSSGNFETFRLEKGGANSASASAQREPAAEPGRDQARTGNVDGR